MYWHHLHATIKNSLNHTFHDRHRVSVVKQQNYNNLRATTDTLEKSSGAAGKAREGLRLKHAKRAVKVLRTVKATKGCGESHYVTVKAAALRLKSQGDGESAKARLKDTQACG